VNRVAQYYKTKALLDYLESLSENEKHLLMQYINLGEKTSYIEEKQPQKQYSFLRGVGENIVGNALWDIPIWVLQKLLSRL